jgi:hypothetical protein
MVCISRIGNAVDAVLWSSGPLGPCEEDLGMSDALSFAEIDGQDVELLPARTVLSLFSAGGGNGGTAGAGGNGSGGLGGNLVDLAAVGGAVNGASGGAGPQN